MLGAAAVASPAVAAPRQYGHLTVDAHHWHLRQTGETLHIWAQGVDVTRNCYEANDVEDYALVYCLDETHHRDRRASGHQHIDVAWQRPCRLRIEGGIVIVPGDPL